MRITVVAAILVIALPLAAGAEVRVERRPDGTVLMVNEGTVRRAADGGTLRPARAAQWEAWIREHAGRNGLDPRLVRAVIQVESAFDPRAVSKKGARGLMQLMPQTARDMSVDDPFDAEQSIRGGTRYLRAMLDAFDHLELALAAYNAGPGAVERHRGIPPFAETVEYVRRVLRLYNGREPELSVRPPAVRGRPVFVRRDAQDRVLVTTEALP